LSEVKVTSKAAVQDAKAGANVLNVRSAQLAKIDTSTVDASPMYNADGNHSCELSYSSPSFRPSAINTLDVLVASKAHMHEHLSPFPAITVPSATSSGSHPPSSLIANNFESSAQWLYSPPCFFVSQHELHANNVKQLDTFMRKSMQYVQEQLGLFEKGDRI
jgi:hypothetical protein